ncbi:hypothetical protein [Bradyrhizobium sp. AZCC 2289]|uniref:hypothetical protein n=1 Tax=Bradyrhizobium sp. AZCC 2289 TaxID=3117026 RepID=UPI002FF17779
MHYDFSNGSIELKAVAFQLVFSTTLLYYTSVKFIQEKNEAGIRGDATQAQVVARRAAAATIRSIEGNPSKRPGLLVWPLRWRRPISKWT